MKSHPAIGCANKNYGVFYLIHRKNIDLIVGAPTAHNKPHHVHSGEVAIYLEAINADLRFLVHPFFQRVLHSLHVSPIQLNPNVY